MMNDVATSPSALAETRMGRPYAYFHSICGHCTSGGSDIKGKADAARKPHVGGGEVKLKSAGARE